MEQSSMVTEINLSTGVAVVGGDVCPLADYPEVSEERSDAEVDIEDLPYPEEDLSDFSGTQAPVPEAVMSVEDQNMLPPHLQDIMRRIKNAYAAVDRNGRRGLPKIGGKAPALYVADLDISPEEKAIITRALEELVRERAMRSLGEDAIVDVKKLQANDRDPED